MEVCRFCYELVGRSSPRTTFLPWGEVNIAASNSALVADLSPPDTFQSSSSVNDTAEFVGTESAFNRRLLTFELKKNFYRKFTIPLFFTFIFNSLVHFLEDALKIHKSLKINPVRM